MDEEVTLTVTGHAIRSEVKQAINKVLTASFRNISRTHSAVPYVAVHVSKLMELAEEKCLASGKHVVHSYDVQSALHQLVVTQPVAEISHVTSDAHPQIEDGKATPVQAVGCLALREQILEKVRPFRAPSADPSLDPKLTEYGRTIRNLIQEALKAASTDLNPGANGGFGDTSIRVLASHLALVMEAAHDRWLQTTYLGDLNHTEMVDAIKKVAGEAYGPMTRAAQATNPAKVAKATNEGRQTTDGVMLREQILGELE
nr:hypothetical protein B0A51_04272 [Rachicladosporium sp. CCFEE 5018]